MLPPAILPSYSIGIETFADFLACLKIGHTFCGNINRCPGTRITPLASFTIPCRERTEATQFHPATFGQTLRNFIKEDVDDLFHFFRP